MGRITYYKNEVEHSLAYVNPMILLEIAQAILDCKGVVYILGNGGSLATATHFSCDLSKNTGKNIITDTLSELPILTAYANDNGYENVFKLQLVEKLTENDILINISTSGNSKNLIQATIFARHHSNKVISLLGHTGGVLKDMSDIKILVESDDIRVVEDIHSIICHILTDLVEKGNYDNANNPDFE